MSALRLSRPGQPTVLRVIDDGCRPYRIGPWYLQAVVTGTPTVRKPLTDAQRAAANTRMREYHHADPARALERQRRYRARMAP